MTEFRVKRVSHVIDYDLVEVVLDLWFGHECSMVVRVENPFDGEGDEDWRRKAFQYAKEWFSVDMPLVFSTAHERDGQGNLIGHFFRTAPIAPSAFKLPIWRKKV